MTFNQADKVIQSILTKSFTGYIDSSTSKNEFDLDMKRMLEMSEFIFLDGVPGLFDTLTDSYV